MMNRISRLALPLCVLSFSLGLLADEVHATDDYINRECKSIEAVFARGSGQSLQANDYDYYNSRLNKYISNTGMGYQIYELGTTHQSGDDGIGYKYPAVPVSGWLNGGFQNAAGAVFSAGLSNDYGKSVEDGVKELALYLGQRFTQEGACSESRIILAGYSQGAQTIGQFMAYNTSWVDQSVLDRIDYVALLGDPKLYLPEGEFNFWRFRSSACLDASDSMYYVSRYRMTVPDCETAAGSLGARKPYATDAFLSKTGLWCNLDDPVCDDRNNILKSESHAQYASLGRIEEAVKESLVLASQKLEPQEEEALLYSLRNDGKAKPAGTEVSLPYKPSPYVEDNPNGGLGYYSPPCVGYIAIDRHQAFEFRFITNYGPNDSDDVMYQATILADLFYQEGCHIELYQYSVLSNEPEFELILESTRDLQLINQALRGAKVTPIPAEEYQSKCVAGVPTRLESAFLRQVVIDDSPNPTEWRVYGMTSGRSMCDWDQAAWDELIGLYDDYDANERIEGWSVGAGVMGVYIDAPMLNNTDVGLFSYQPGVRSMSTFSALEAPSTDYRLRFDRDEYHIQTGANSAVTVAPHNPAVAIEEYRLFMWDYDGDGTIDAMTTEPIASLNYSEPGNYVLTVHSQTVEGTRVSEQANIVVSDSLEGVFADRERPAAATNVVIEELSDSSISVEWQPADDLATYWLIQLNDAPGTLVDIGAKSRVEITDVDLSKPINVRVLGVTSDGYRGEATTAEIERAGEGEPRADSGRAGDELSPILELASIFDAKKSASYDFAKVKSATTAVPSGPVTGGNGALDQILATMQTSSRQQNANNLWRNLSFVFIGLVLAIFSFSYHASKKRAS